MGNLSITGLSSLPRGQQCMGLSVTSVGSLHLTFDISRKHGSNEKTKFTVTEAIREIYNDSDSRDDDNDREDSEYHSESGSSPESSPESNIEEVSSMSHPYHSVNLSIMQIETIDP